MDALRIVVVTVTTSRTSQTDAAGPALAAALEKAGHSVTRPAPIADAVAAIRDVVRVASEDGSADVMVLTGGTGITREDVTPEALEPLFVKRIDGFGEAFRRLSWERVGPHAMLSRATAGVVGTLLVFAVPGSPGAAELGAELVAGLLPHAADLAAGRHGHHRHQTKA